MTILKRIFGLLILFVGLVLLGWIAYNVFVETQPAAAGKKPLPAFFVSIGAIYVGARWLFAKRKETSNKSLQPSAGRSDE